MKKSIPLMLLATMMFAASVLAGSDPIVGTWKLNVAKSKFIAGSELTAATRVYKVSAGTYTLEQKLTGKDGKEISNKAQYSEGKDVKQSEPGSIDTVHAKMIDANTWDFDLAKNGKSVGHVHRVVSSDGKTLTVHNSGAQLGGAQGDEVLVFDKQ
jgi:hypothetical protein